MDQNYEKVGFIGAGNMAEAIAGALIDSGVYKSKNIMMSDINTDRLDFIKNTYGVEITTNSDDLVMNSDIIILSVKPQVMEKVLDNICSSFETNKRKLFISIAAGIKSEKIESYLYNNITDEAKSLLPVVRVMPNTPSMVLSGMSGMSVNNHCTDSDVEVTRVILESMGKVIQVKEEEIDAITAMSGSGPAYIFYFIESMMQAGVDMGFSDAVTKLLTLETFKGALKLMEKSGKSPAVLRKNVTSPGGTTEAALKVMEDRNIKNSIVDAIKTAKRRSIELSG
ncbi:MAG: pyrroline-5-carboxylate reductase [Desulfobacterales bacterium]|nr:pyrroline-5-carboxylate reductase [Desulfobacterales bacterium]MCP4159541.1 pyrroline-5-carboxylate reductase [Deltaproteobacteria bacterium]